jgi:hypothetical protein
VILTSSIAKESSVVVPKIISAFVSIVSFIFSIISVTAKSERFLLKVQ